MSILSRPITVGFGIMVAGKETAGMRRAKIPSEIVEQKVLESLRRRADPVTRRVYPSWRLMMREIGVCRQRIADAINCLKASGQISVIIVPPPEGSNKRPGYCYELFD
jgi:hypothetical protein